MKLDYKPKWLCDKEVLIDFYKGIYASKISTNDVGNTQYNLAEELLTSAIVGSTL